MAQRKDRANIASTTTMAMIFTAPMVCRFLQRGAPARRIPHSGQVCDWVVRSAEIFSLSFRAFLQYAWSPP
jgi:hypothetical protein